MSTPRVDLENGNPLTAHEQFTTRVLTLPGEFKRLREDWNRLVKSNPDSSIFLTWEWLYTWFEVFNRDRQLRIVLVFDGDEIIGIGPFVLQTVRRLGFIRVRRIGFLATGENEEDEICSSYLNIIAKSGFEQIVQRHIGAYLDKTRNDWDEIWLREIPGNDSSFSNIEDQFAQARYRRSLIRGPACLVVALPATWQEFMMRLSHDNRSKVKRFRTKLTSMEGFHCVTVSRLAEIIELLDTFAALHAKRWNRRNYPGVFASALFTSFHKKVLALLDEGDAWLQFLKLGETTIAGIFCYVFQGKVYDYQLCFDPDIQPSLSLGRQITYSAIEYCVAHGMKEWDFLHGTTDSYKSEWRPEPRQLYELRIVRRTLSSGLVETADFWQARIKSVVRAA